MGSRRGAPVVACPRATCVFVSCLVVEMRAGSERRMRLMICCGGIAAAMRADASALRAGIITAAIGGECCHAAVEWKWWIVLCSRCVALL